MFLQAYQHLPEDQPRNLRAWLGKIAVNKSIDWKRKQIPLLDESYASNLIDEDDSPEKQFIKAESQALFKDMCLDLPSIYGQIILKYYFEEKSYQEIASEENISLKTVESRLYRARRLLKEKWRQEEFEAPYSK